MRRAIFARESAEGGGEGSGCRDQHGARAVFIGFECELVVGHDDGSFECAFWHGLTDESWGSDATVSIYRDGCGFAHSYTFWEARELGEPCEGYALVRERRAAARARARLTSSLLVGRLPLDVPRLRRMSLALASFTGVAGGGRRLAQNLALVKWPDRSALVVR